MKIGGGYYNPISKNTWWQYDNYLRVGAFWLYPHAEKKILKLPKKMLVDNDFLSVVLVTPMNLCVYRQWESVMVFIFLVMTIKNDIEL